ncbi:FadR/GntR family transcriptional regulator [Neobacillus drentensis]|uniref:FadR/GntR family transcriptional regulator n=1 Tax=Neobacillus drentensis TaxID=220684 RepID=UPI002FFE1228
MNKQKLVDQVLIQLQSIIQSEKYEIGDKLPSEAELMKLLNVGRSTVREAIKILVYSGSLEVKQGDGTYIRSTAFSEESLEMNLQHADEQDLNEVIQILDIQISGLAAERRTESDLRRIKQHLENRNHFLKEEKYDQYLKSDLQFHQAVCQATHNSVLIEMYDSICRLLLQMLPALILDTRDYYKENTLVHKKLYTAIEDQNVKEAIKWAKVNIKLRNSLKV